MAVLASEEGVMNHDVLKTVIADQWERIRQAVFPNRFCSVIDASI